MGCTGYVCGVHGCCCELTWFRECTKAPFLSSHSAASFLPTKASRCSRDPVETWSFCDEGGGKKNSS